jgi:hypothetical protein
MKNRLVIFISPPLTPHPSCPYLIFSLSSLFTQSTISNACLLLNHRFSHWTSYVHDPSGTVMPINIVASLLFLLYTFETLSMTLHWKGLFYFSWQSEELPCMSHATCLIPQKSSFLFHFSSPHTPHISFLPRVSSLSSASPRWVLNQRCISYPQQIG